MVTLIAVTETANIIKLFPLIIFAVLEQLLNKFGWYVGLNNISWI